MIFDKQFLRVRSVADGYGFGFGSCNILQSPKYIIFEFYNAGFSDCEEADSELKKFASPIVDDHPMTVYIFRTAYLDKESYAGLITKKIKKYIYNVRRD